MMKKYSLVYIVTNGAELFYALGLAISYVKLEKYAKDDAVRLSALNLC